MLLYRDVDGIAEVRKAIEVVAGKLPHPESHAERTVAFLSPYRTAYRGGDAAVRFLVPVPGESNTQWLQRRRHFENVPLIETIIEEQATQVYGIGPDRTIRYEDDENGDTPATEEMDEAFRRIYDEANHKSLFRDRVAPAVFLDQWCSVKVWYQDETSKLRLSYLPRDNAYPIFDPMDLDTAIGWVEIRRVGRDWVRWLWTTTEYGLIDADWKWQTMSSPEAERFESETGSWPVANPVPGVLPYVLFGSVNHDGHRLETALQQQRALINDTSGYKIGRRSQAGSIPVTTHGPEGAILTPEQVDPQTGERYVKVGINNGLELEHGSSFQFAKPDYPITEMAEALSDDQRLYLSWNRISPLSVDSSGVPDQPMALALKMFVPQMERQRNINMLEAAETRLGEVVHAYAMAYVDDYPATESPVVVEIDFPESVLPMDKTAERAADAADVPEKMTLFRYLQKWDMAGESDQAINSEVEKIRADVNTGRSTLADLLSPNRRDKANAGGSRFDLRKGSGPVEGSSGNGISGGATTVTPPSGGSGPTDGGGAGGGGGKGSPQI